MERSRAVDRRGLTILELLAVLAILAILTVGLIALCNRRGGGPLTAADGSRAADGIHGDLLDLIANSQTPVSEIVGEIRTSLLAEADAVRGREGATQFIDGLCARLRELTQNRIRSTPDARERDRLREFLRELDRLCREARGRATAPP